MAESLTEDQIEAFRQDYQELFNDILPGDLIKRLEIFKNLFYIPEKEESDLKKRIKQTASPSEEILDFPMFLMYKAREMNQDISESIYKDFSDYDKDGSGLLHINQIKEVFQVKLSLNEQDIAEALEYAKIDQNGMVNYIELVDKLINI